jgi:hypothetical protein
MLATLISTQIAKWNINQCCFCLDQSFGVKVYYFINKTEKASSH